MKRVELIILRIQPKKGKIAMKATSFLGLVLVCSALAGCGLVRTGPSANERLDRELTMQRLMASNATKSVKISYVTAKNMTARDYSDQEGAYLVAILLDDRYWETLSLEKTLCVKSEEKPIIPYPSCQKDEIGIGPYDEAREYLSFIKSQARQIQQGRLTVEEADYRILAKGNEIEQRFKEEFAAAERKQQMQNGSLPSRMRRLTQMKLWVSKPTQAAIKISVYPRPSRSSCANPYLR
jgi:hypothetical protein